jgi:hypothetical protein
VVELLQVVARRGRQPELVADEVFEHGAGVAADGAVRFVGDDEIEVGRREQSRYLSLNSSDCTVVTTISALRQSSRRSL